MYLSLWISRGVSQQYLIAWCSDLNTIENLCTFIRYLAYHMTRVLHLGAKRKVLASCKNPTNVLGYQSFSLDQSYFGTLVKTSKNNYVGYILYGRWLDVCECACKHCHVWCMRLHSYGVFRAFMLCGVCARIWYIQYSMVVYSYIYCAHTHLMFVEFCRYWKKNSSYFVTKFL